MPLLVQDVVEGLPNGVGDQPIAYETPVHEEVLVITRAAVEGGRSDQTAQAHVDRLLIQHQSSSLELLPQQGARALLISLGRQPPERAAVMLQGHSRVRPRQGN